MSIGLIGPCIAIMRPAAAALAIFSALWGAAVGDAATTTAKAAPFDPVAFFTGKTRGAGTLRQILSKPRSLTVTSLGTVREDGALVLDQTVAVTGEKVRTRQWQLRETGPGRFAGTLSDARGPVAAQVTGNVLHISYTMTDGGMAVEQAITLQPGGQTAQNVMKIRKLGITFATLEETISRD